MSTTHLHTVLPVKTVNDSFHPGKRIPFISLDHQIRNAIAVWFSQCVNKHMEAHHTAVWTDKSRIVVEGTATAVDIEYTEVPGNSLLRYLTRHIDPEEVISRTRHVTPTQLDDLITNCRTKTPINS
ncbi:hypothetical protein V3M81_08955 [Trueperella pyogenes]|uniref:Uncharacterized protein n=1 Tax=Trueperella pyogenes TaxID=1661 RepID=A0A3Q9GJL9_9ACTO|nr:hypothetical protein [Trueperella pyogenes]AZR06347.1 hypothetical protein EBQ10_02930 [Trueperella pyogenes]